MKYLTRYYELNGGGLMLMRKVFGWLWVDYEPFDNRKNKQKAKLNEIARKFEQEYAALRELNREELAIREKIKNSREAKKGFSIAEVLSLPLWPRSHQTIPEPDRHWEKYARVADGKRSNMAESIADTMDHSGMKIVNDAPFNGSKSDKATVDIETVEIVGTDIIPAYEQKGNQQKQRNRQQQNGNGQ